MAFSLICLKQRCTGTNPFEENEDIISHVAGFVKDTEYLFFASVCRRWKRIWGQRPTSTKAVTPSTSVAQLSYSFECGLGRTPVICTTTIEIGRLDLLCCARANNCPWLGDMCEVAAKAGDLNALKWARARGCPWGPETCALLAEGGHLKALQWCRENGCPWDKETLEATSDVEVTLWAMANGCPDWSDDDDY